jgi:hypothetical protein
MLRFRRAMALGLRPCGLKNLFKFAQGLCACKAWLGYAGFAAGCNVQHPEWHFQNPTSLKVFQTAECYCPTESYETSTNPHSSAVPRMPGITDFTDISNMGVVLVSCIIASATTKKSVTFYCSRNTKWANKSPGGECAVVSALAGC